jgi:hypothetical protein
MARRLISAFVFFMSVLALASIDSRSAKPAIGDQRIGNMPISQVAPAGGAKTCRTYRTITVFDTHPHIVVVFKRVVIIPDSEKGKAEAEENEKLVKQQRDKETERKNFKKICPDGCCRVAHVTNVGREVIRRERQYVKESLVPVWTLLQPADIPPRDVAGYGLVAFPSKALPTEVNRHKAVCEAFKAALIPQTDLRMSGKPQKHLTAAPFPAIPFHQESSPNKIYHRRPRFWRAKRRLVSLRSLV